MSWDTFVQDVPSSAISIRDIPENFTPRPIGQYAVIVDAIVAVLPFADTTDRKWIKMDAQGVDLEISIDDTDPVESFVFHVRGGEHSVGAIAEILSRLGLRALYPQSACGIFDISSAAESVARWQAYRESIASS